MVSALRSIPSNVQRWVRPNVAPTQNEAHQGSPRSNIHNGTIALIRLNKSPIYTLEGVPRQDVYRQQQDGNSLCIFIQNNAKLIIAVN